MDKQAYPQLHNLTPREPFSMEKWREAELKIAHAGRMWPEYSARDLTEHFTSDWDEQERVAFKDWRRWNKNNRSEYIRMGSMNKVAYDFNASNKEEQLKDLKKKLRSRVNSAEKLLNKISDEGLLAGNEEKALYIGRILQKLKEEINLLSRPALIQGRLKRARRIAAESRLEEIADVIATGIVLVSEHCRGAFIKTAQEGNLNGVLDAIKQELDMVDYGYHLNKLMEIRGQLERAGRHSEAGMVVDVIKKELSELDGIHKKLLDVYTSIGRVRTQSVTRKPQRNEQSVEDRVRQEQERLEEPQDLGIERPRLEEPTF